MANAFGKHYNENFEIYDELIDAGKISIDDLDKAANATGDVSFAEQDAANKKIYDYLQDFAKKNPDDDEVQKFVSSFPHQEKFNPDKNKWKIYTDDEMARLAETMKFNWANPEEKKEMLQILQGEDKAKVKDELKKYQHSYLGMDTDNPINRGLNWLADKIISDDTINAVAEDPSNTGRIVGNAAADIGGTAADFLPGAGGIIAGPAIRAARDVAEGKEAGDILENVAKDVGTNAIVGLSLKGIGGVADDVPIFKQAARKTKDTIGKWGQKVETAEKKVTRAKVDVKPTKNIDDFQKQIDNLPAKEQAPYEQLLNEKHGYRNKEKIDELNKKTNENRKMERREKEHAMRWAENNKGKVAVAKGMAQTGAGAARTTGHSMQERKGKVPKIEDVFRSPELADWVHQKKLGYNPPIPEKFKEYEAALDSMIHDPSRNLR